MKKIIITLLILIILLSCVACGGTPSIDASASLSPSQSANPNATANPSATPSGTVLPSETPTPTTTPDNLRTIGEFEVSYEVYKDSANNDVIIMLVNNTADTPCNLQVTVKYLDENSEVKKTQTQAFEGFAANWSNYFIFQSYQKNSIIECDITSTPFDGEVLSHYIHPDEGGVKILIDKNGTEYIRLKDATEKEIKKAKDVRVKLSAYSTFYGTPLTANATGVLIDNNGKISFTRTFEFFNLGGIANPYLGFGPICGDRPEPTGGQDNPEAAAKVKADIYNFTNFKSYMSIISVERTVLDWDEFNEAVKENQK